MSQSSPSESSPNRMKPRATFTEGDTQGSSRKKHRLPSVVGDYHIIERIGKGGRSYVFSARQRIVERTVALKILRPQLVQQHSEFLAFKREAGAYGACDHPNILTCYQAGQDMGWHFMALSHAAKGDAMNALRGTSRREAMYRIIKWCGQMAKAVDHLQSRGFVHGDIKPANILVGADDHALLADLGSLHPLEDDGEPRRFEGSPAYMSPEHARREKLSVVADVYAIGASAYHLLTGKSPRPACSDKKEALRRAAEEPLQPIREVAPWLPKSVAAVVERCLQPDPSHRYLRPMDLSRAAKQVLEGLNNENEAPVHPSVNFAQGF